MQTPRQPVHHHRLNNIYTASNHRRSTFSNSTSSTAHRRTQLLRRRLHRRLELLAADRANASSDCRLAAGGMPITINSNPSRSNSPTDLPRIHTLHTKQQATQRSPFRHSRCNNRPSSTTSPNSTMASRLCRSRLPSRMLLRLGLVVLFPPVRSLPQHRLKPVLGPRHKFAGTLAFQYRLHHRVLRHPALALRVPTGPPASLIPGTLSWLPIHVAHHQLA